MRYFCIILLSLIPILAYSSPIRSHTHFGKNKIFSADVQTLAAKQCPDIKTLLNLPSCGPATPGYGPGHVNYAQTPSKWPHHWCFEGVKRSDMSYVLLYPKYATSQEFIAQDQHGKMWHLQGYACLYGGILHHALDKNTWIATYCMQQYGRTDCVIHQK